MSGTSTPIIYARSVQSDLYAWALASAYRSGWRLYDPDYALSRDVDIYEKARRDPIIAGAIEQRTHAIAGRRFRIEPAREENEEDRKIASLFEDLVGETRRFSEARYELATAVVRNRTYAYMEGEKRFENFAGLGGQDWYVVTRFRDIDRRRVRIVPEWHGEGPTRSLSTFLELFSVVHQDWRRLEHPEWFVRHIYNDEEARLGHGRGLLEAIYFYMYAKEITLREGLQGLERWAQGLAVASVDGVREASSGKPNDEVVNSWMEAIVNTKARHALVIDSRDKLDVYHPSGEGANLVKDTLTYLDEGITKLVTGALRPTGGGEGGSYSRAEVEQDESEGLVQYDREILDEILTRDYLGHLFRQNQPTLRKVGLGQAKCPRFSTVQEKREDPESASAVIATVLPLGIKLRSEEVYQKIGFSQPKEGDPVIEAPEQLPGATPGAGGSYLPPELERALVGRDD